MRIKNINNILSIKIDYYLSILGLALFVAIFNKWIVFFPGESKIYTLVSVVFSIVIYMKQKTIIFDKNTNQVTIRNNRFLLFFKKTYDLSEIEAVIYKKQDWDSCTTQVLLLRRSNKPMAITFNTSTGNKSKLKLARTIAEFLGIRLYEENQ